MRKLQRPRNSLGQYKVSILHNLTCSMLRPTVTFKINHWWPNLKMKRKRNKTKWHQLAVAVHFTFSKCLECMTTGFSTHWVSNIWTQGWSQWLLWLYSICSGLNMHLNLKKHNRSLHWCHFHGLQSFFMGSYLTLSQYLEPERRATWLWWVYYSSWQHLQ